MENKELKMVQLHTLIQEETERDLSKLQGKILMDKGQRISKSIIINQALQEYLKYKLEEKE